MRCAFKRWAWLRYYDPPLCITADSAVLPIKYSALVRSWKNRVLPESQGSQVSSRAGPKRRNPYSNLVHLLAGFLASFPSKRNCFVWLVILVFLSSFLFVGGSDFYAQWILMRTPAGFSFTTAGKKKKIQETTQHPLTRNSDVGEGGVFVSARMKFCRVCVFFISLPNNHSARRLQPN